MVSFHADFQRKTVEIYRPTSVTFFCVFLLPVGVHASPCKLSNFDSSIAVIGDLSRHILEFCVFDETARLLRHCLT